MTNERLILRTIISFHAQNGAYPTIGDVAAALKQGANAVAKVVLRSQRIDYTVPARGEKSWRDDACNWTVEPVL